MSQQDRIRLTHKEYTVGWICALATELAAARGMLDVLHDSLPLDRRDSNNYTLGRVGPHNVAIACLPEGVTGVTSAARVAEEMMWTFTSLRFGLMVGIGGGVPDAQNDIRLGDVVVSTPKGSFGGVIQYDYGKTVQEGRFERTGSHNRPPDVLLKAIASVKATHMVEGPVFPKFLAEMGSKFPRLGAASRPLDFLADKLFDADYDHVPGEITCDKCRTDRQVTRPMREEDGPKVHYGLVASGNQVMKDGKTRMRLHQELNILCFETEAAGLMDNFPCLVIRGICDYSDSHKNKEWQGYAAATAAAYAKELLNTVAGSQIEITETVTQMMGSTATPASFTKEEETDCLKSLYFEEMNLRRNDIGLAADKTCTWLLKHQNYSTWLGQRYGLLWIKGKPGSGKSVLMDTLLRNVERQAPVDGFVVASFFFHGRGSHMQRTPIGLFRSLLHQILRQIPPLLSRFCSEFIFRRETRGKPGVAWDWDVKYLQEFLESEVLTLSQTYPIKIFADALDECGETAGRDLVSYFQRMTSKLPATRFALSVCFSCRHYPVMDFEGCGLDICVEKENSADIASYVRDKIQPVFQDHESRQSLECDILDKASGVFLWAVLVVPAIIDLRINGENIKAIREELKLIPRELENVYQDILKNIHKKNLPKSLQLIQWICLANYPLSLRELQFAMGFDADAPYRSVQAWRDSIDYAEDNEQMRKRIKALSGGLVEALGWDDVAQFIHQSVKDYFIHGGLQSLEEKLSEVCLVGEDLQSCEKVSSGSAISRGHHRLSRSCIKYFTAEERHAPMDYWRFPFLQYAVSNWASHAAQAEMENISQEDLLDFFQWPPNSIPDSGILMMSGEYPRYYKGLSGHATLMHLASRYGLLSVLIAIFRRDEGTDPDPKDSEGRTPLLKAMVNECEGVVKLLLEKGADPDFKDPISRRTPLSWAAEHGNVAMVKLLLEKNVALDSRDAQLGQTPLWRAAINAHEAVTKLLLEKGADQKSMSASGQTPLSWAAEHGRENMVKALLKAGANPNNESSFNQTPLLFAVMNDHIAVAMLLLESNANLDIKDSKYGRTPLSWAADNRSMAFVMLLLEKGANPDFKSSFNRTPLLVAAMKGHEAVVKLLLSRHADPDSKDSKYGQTPLSWAAKNGHKAVVKLLLKEHVVLDSMDTEYKRTPLSWAAGDGRTAIVKLLLERGANPGLGCRSNRTPLLYAAESGHEAVVKLLLDKGADPNSKDSKHDRTPLSWAAMYGHVGVVTLLLEKTVDPDPKDSKHQTPLGWAVMYGHEAVTKLLLEKGADPNSQLSSGQTLLLRAVENGDVAIASLLLEKGAKLDSESSSDWTPLSLAAQNGQQAMAKLLLERGADPNKLGCGKTPLSWAAGREHREVAKLLVEKGADPALDMVADYYHWL